MEDFVPYKEALCLKKLGFNDPCIAIWSGFDEINFSVTDTVRLFSSKFSINDVQSSTSYINPSDNRVSAPLYHQVFKWFRKNHNLFVTIPHSIRSNTFAYLIGTENDGWLNYKDRFSSYEKAELECLRQLIKIIKDRTSEKY